MGSLLQPRLVLVLACLIPIIGAFLVSDGLFTIDELIYLISAEAMATSGSLTVENGFEQLGSEDLRLWFLVEGPNGLAPQYPPGLAILSTPFYLLFEDRGLILVNACAAAGVALLTWALARKLYTETSIAMVSVLILTFSTFHLEYAWSVWPHMTCAFFVLLAFYLALNALEREDTGSVIGFAFASGLSIGAGMLVRADAFLILPVIAACIVLFAQRPFLTILGGTLGLLPGFAASTWINSYKFGETTVLSYGRSGAGGGDDVHTHLAAALVLAALMLGLLVVRILSWTKPRVTFALFCMLVLVLCLALLQTTRELLWPILRGYFTLFVDMRTIDDIRHGIVRTDDGSLMFWGVAKKAIVQSLPWLAVLAALLIAPWRTDHRRPHTILLLFTVIWGLPFAALSWHGGFSSGMRYFLPMVPALVLLGASLIVEWAAKVERPVVIASVGGIASVALTMALYDNDNFRTDGFTQQAMTLWTFATVFVLLCSTKLIQRVWSNVHNVSFGAVGFAIATATTGSLLVDVSMAQNVRLKSEYASKIVEQVEGPALVYGSPKLYAFAVARDDIILGVSERLDQEIDIGLFLDALNSGYRVYTSNVTAEIVTEATDLTFVGMDISPKQYFVEIVRNP